MSDVSAARARAAAFVAERGDELDRLRADALQGLRSGSEVAAFLSRGDAAPADLDDALRRLGALGDLRAFREPLTEATCAWLTDVQRDDGSFGDEAFPGDRIVATGTAAGHLAKTPWARPEILDAAGDFLAREFSPERVQGFAWANVAAFAHFFTNAPHDEGDPILQWCGRELERGFRARRFDAVRTARVFVWCDAGALPGAKLDSRELAPALLAEQQSDGGWLEASQPDPAARVSHTLDGLVALIRFSP